jgi:hypothetical protein
MGTGTRLDVGALNGALARMQNTYGAPTRIGGIEFRSKLEALWYQTFMDETRLHGVRARQVQARDTEGRRQRLVRRDVHT